MKIHIFHVKPEVFAGTILLFLLFINTSFPSNVAIVLSFVVLFFTLRYRVRMPARNTLLLISCTAFYLFTLWTVFLFFQLEIGKQYWMETRKLVLAFLYHVGLVFLFNNREKVLAKIVTWTLCINVGFYWCQIIFFYIGGLYLDPLKWLGIREQKTAAYFLRGTILKEDAFCRPAGFLNEPGTYGSVILLLLVIHYLIDRKLKPIHIAALISMLSSLSFFAIIGSMIFVSMLLFERFYFKSHNKRIFYAIFAVVLVVGFVSLLYQYIDIRFHQSRSSDGGLSFREYIVDSWMHFSLTRRVLGSGPLVGDLTLGRFRGSCGFLFYLIYTLGIFSFPLIFIFRCYCKSRLSFSYFACIFFVKIPSLNYYPLWAGLACIYCMHEHHNSVTRPFEIKGLKKQRKSNFRPNYKIQPKIFQKGES